MVNDHARAEDVTQDVFISALRRMRETERPIAFKPWIYEIAKNACIDQFRRSRRAEEVSFDADDGLGPPTTAASSAPSRRPTSRSTPSSSSTHLCGAFGGLSETHHEILVLRELEGLSYREIGERMGMSRPAVESTLFRARRRLTEEYDELVTGAALPAHPGDHRRPPASGRLGARDTRRLARHVSHCQPCRRQALAAGVDTALAGPPPDARPRDREDRRAVRRSRCCSAAAAAATRARLVEPAADGPDHAAAGGAKLAAAAAVVVAGLGAGVGTQVVPARRDGPPAPAPRRTGEVRAPPKSPRRRPARRRRRAAPGRKTRPAQAARASAPAARSRAAQRRARRLAAALAARPRRRPGAAAPAVRRRAPRRRGRPSRPRRRPGRSPATRRGAVDRPTVRLAGGTEAPTVALPRRPVTATRSTPPPRP